MNRRAFVGLAAVAPFLLQRAGGLQLSTPVSAGTKKPEPISLADGLTMVDYRFGHAYGDRESGTIEFLAEIHSSATTAITPPQVVLSFHDADDNVIAENTAFPVIGAIQSNQPDFLRGEWQATDFDPSRDPWSSLVCSLAYDWSIETAAQSEGEVQSLSLTGVSQTSEAKSWTARGYVANGSDHAIKQVQVYAIFRDANRRYAGYGWTDIQSSIPAGKRARFTVDVGVNTMVPVSPFEFTTGTNYKVKLVLAGGVQG